MIAVDTSVLIDYFLGLHRSHVERLLAFIDKKEVVLPMVVVTELLSSPNPQPDYYWQIEQIPRLPIREGYWERTGLLRAKILKQKLKAHLGDALIAQACIDNDVPLLTSDPDFRHYVDAGGLKLAVCE